MEMAKYIMSILRSELMVMWSWGFHSPVVIPNGLKFKVEGFKFVGWVEVKYNQGADLFDISFTKSGKVVKAINGVFFDELVSVIDNYVEKTANYAERVRKEYSIN